MIRGQDYSSGSVRNDDLYYVDPRLAASFSRASVQGGDLLLSIVGYVGTVAEVPGELAGANLTQTTARISVRDDLKGRYFLHFLRSRFFRDEIGRFTKGSAQPGLNLADVEVMRVSYPQNAAERAAIAEVLDSLETTIRQTEAIIEKLKQVKQGLLHDLLTRGIDANGELRPPQKQAPHLYKDSPLGWIPREWTVDFLGELAEVAGGVTLGRSVTGIGTLELPYLRVANVQDGYLDLREIKTIRILSSEIARYRLEPGDVLMNEGGDFDKLGRGVMWSGEIDTCLHQNHVFRVRCQRSSLDPRYLTAYSSSGFGKAFFVRASKQTTNLASINSTQLKAFPLRLPKLAEQDAIVDGLAAIDLRVRAEGATLEKARLQKSGLMDDLLTGRVRVTALLEPSVA